MWIYTIIKKSPSQRNLICNIYRYMKPWNDATKSWMNSMTCNFLKWKKSLLLIILQSFQNTCILPENESDISQTQDLDRIKRLFLTSFYIFKCLINKTEKKKIRSRDMPLKTLTLISQPSLHWVILVTVKFILIKISG